MACCIPFSRREKEPTGSHFGAFGDPTNTNTLQQVASGGGPNTNATINCIILLRINYIERLINDINRFINGFSRFTHRIHQLINGINRFSIAFFG